MVVAAHLAHWPNNNLLLQNQNPFLSQTYGHHPVEPYQQICPRCHAFHCQIVAMGYMTLGMLSHLKDNNYHSHSFESYGASSAAGASIILSRLSSYYLEYHWFKNAYML